MIAANPKTLTADVLWKKKRMMIKARPMERMMRMKKV
jgi:hypothetical protein